MPDLFDQTGAEPEQTGARQFTPPLVNRRTGALAHTSAPVAHSGAAGEPDAGGRPPVNRRNTKKETDIRALLQRRQSLETTLEAARAEEMEAAECQRPYEEVWKVVDGYMRDLAVRRSHGEQIDRAVWFRGLDNRLAAGHAWQPFRERARDATRWANAIRKELMEINAEIAK